MTDALKAVVAEWVLTNGQLPGYEDRLKATFSDWSVVGKAGMYVYRGQGGSIVPKVGNTTIDVLKEGIRPVIATSKTYKSIERYTSKDCCLFIIYLAPGVRYIDVNKLITGVDKDNKPFLSVKNSVLDAILENCPEASKDNKFWPTKDVPASTARKVILERCLGRDFPALTQGGQITRVIIPPEHEVLLDGNQGVFERQTEVANSYFIPGIKTFTLQYNLKKQKEGGKRKKTQRRKRRVIVFRRTSKRLNKNE